MKFNDLSLGLIVLIGGIAVFLSALQFTPIPGQAYGADTMPRVIGAGTIILGLVLIVRGVMTDGMVPRLARAEWAHSPRAILNLLIAIALVILYIVFSPSIGFVICALALQLALMLMRGVRPIPAIIVSIIATVVIQQAFGRLLLVPLPRNAAFGFLW
ncbi:tripartite tricarboxylate transporter TctB family protein [Acuticoccus sp. M5D2P5]|uniref:tripartite tricarboxylate transporter TctB family protein n=1 Tax=Acuticoccus kalidii TaxID=2910977 RepID=UPI001F4750B9|nr:tripartite tricarboxylate transporter TctB family protein [Acuticoccus kalidii]MCF3934689.1 tripartite tricarboxylate transporter TctB family protein [Acuticoccus kalidii]